MEDKPTVLIIEDNPVNSALLEAVLSKDGYKTLQAESGPDGRVLALVHSPDLIFLDILMPDESGFETCGALKLDPRTADIPVIFLSSIQEVEEKVKGLTLGAVDYITKPFNRDELLARARIHVKLKQRYAPRVKDSAAATKQPQDRPKPLSIKPQGLPGKSFDQGIPRGTTAANKLMSPVTARKLLSSLPKQVVLQPGEHYATKERVTIRTILGSCVAACLWDQENRIIGINHFLLAGKPGSNGKNSAFSQTEAGRYGIYAMELLINAMMKLGARRQNLQAKVFGGGSVLRSERSGNHFDVGEANSRFIVEFLKTDGIPLINSDLGGSSGRVIYFSSIDFSVYVRKIGKIRQDKVALEERIFWTKSLEKQETANREPEVWI